MIVFVSVIMLLIVESASNKSVQLVEVVFEVVSAFGTVGLSLGLTPGLTSAGMWIHDVSHFGYGHIKVELPRQS